MRRRLMRHDANHNSICKALEQVGASVADLSQIGGGLPDILVGWRSALFLIEIKNPDNAYGRKGLSESQSKFVNGWNGNKVLVVWTAEQALKCIGAIK